MNFAIKIIIIIAIDIFVTLVKDNLLPEPINECPLPIKINLTNEELFYNENTTNLPPIYMITPSFKCPEQIAELVRLGYTLKHVKNLIWLVVEDSDIPSIHVTKTLMHIGVRFHHLTGPMPQSYKKLKVPQPLGVSNWNRGILWIRQNYKNYITNNGEKGVLHFAKLGPAYEISVFEEIRYTKKISMWPVGLSTKYGLSSPIVENGQFVDFYDFRNDKTEYAVMFAGFAISVEFLLTRPFARIPFYQYNYDSIEDGFLLSLLPFDVNEIELLSNNCTEISVWNLDTMNFRYNKSRINIDRYRRTNLEFLNAVMIHENYH